VCWPRTRKQTVLTSRTAWPWQRRWEILVNHRNRRWNLGVWLWYRNQVSVVMVGGEGIVPTEESSNESSQHEHIFGFLWLARYNPPRIRFTWLDSKQGVLRSSSEAFEGSRTPAEASAVDEPELNVAPRQCTSSLVVPCAQFSGEKRNDRCTPAILLSRFVSSAFFSVS
jgi:hypothetical protein